MNDVQQQIKQFEEEIEGIFEVLVAIEEPLEKLPNTHAEDGLGTIIGDVANRLRDACGQEDGEDEAQHLDRTICVQVGIAAQTLTAVVDLLNGKVTPRQRRVASTLDGIAKRLHELSEEANKARDILYLGSAGVATQ